jgi:hypothetical protein
VAFTELGRSQAFTKARSPKRAATTPNSSIAVQRLVLHRSVTPRPVSRSIGYTVLDSATIVHTKWGRESLDTFEGNPEKTRCRRRLKNVPGRYERYTISVGIVWAN